MHRVLQRCRACSICIRMQSPPSSHPRILPVHLQLTEDRRASRLAGTNGDITPFPRSALSKTQKKKKKDLPPDRLELISGSCAKDTYQIQGRAPWCGSGQRTWGQKGKESDWKGMREGSLSYRRGINQH